MGEQELKAKVDAYVDEVWEDVVRDIDTLVQVESVEDLQQAAPGAPWGPNAAEALSRALAMAERLGLETRSIDGAIGYGELKGASDTCVATIAHVDIVPLGNGWTVNPLAVTRKDGYLLGRGVLDDKGPFVLSLYAAHFFARQVAETGEKLPYTLRAIAGANEETGMGDVDAYLDECGEPRFLFTPDADFPLICGEKGIFHGLFTSAEMDSERVVVELDGGIVANAIPGEAHALVRADAASLPEAPCLSIEAAEDGMARIHAKGKGGHASMPQGTVNAIGLIVSYLLENLPLGEGERGWLELVDKLVSVSDGSGMGLACADDKFGALTAIGGVHATASERFSQTIDVRYPTATTGEKLAQTLGELAKQCGASFSVTHDAKPFYIEPESPEIQALLRTYAEYTGHEAAPVVIGGGTYARHFERACAFGPNDPFAELPEWVGPEHGPDEGIAEETLKTALKIYIVSIARLMALDLN